MKRIELFILSWMLRKRESMIAVDFDPKLSLEIDLLLSLIERVSE